MRDHTSLIAWQRARAVSLASMALCRTRWKPYAAAVFDQLLRASTSVQLNIAEGYAVRLPGRARYHYGIAYGSSVETVECLELLRDGKILAPEVVDPLIATARETSRLLLRLLKGMPRQSDAG